MINNSKDIVRQLRLLEYIGERSWLEHTMANNGVKGERRCGGVNRIREATVGQFPESVNGWYEGYKEAWEEVAELLGRVVNTLFIFEAILALAGIDNPKDVERLARLYWAGREKQVDISSSRYARLHSEIDRLVLDQQPEGLDKPSPTEYNKNRPAEETAAGSDPEKGAPHE